jgi:predicted Zn-dependent protease
MSLRRANCLWILLSLIASLLSGSLGTKADALTMEEERKIGKQVFVEIEKGGGIAEDLTLQGFIDRVGRSLVPHAGPTPFDFRFYVVKDQNANAFAVPGGYVFTTTGLLVLAESEDEVAGVVSHEIAHVTSRHIADLIDRSKRMSLVTLAAMLAGALAGGQASQAITTSAMAAQQTMALKYTRDHETEADQNGLHTLIKTGYDPHGLVTFLNKLYKQSLASAPKIPAYLSTHPGPENRVALLESLIQIEPKPPGSPKTSEDFRWIQARAFLAEREADVAVRYFESMVRTNPQDEVELLGLGLAYRKMGRFDKSVEALQQALELAPQDLVLSEELAVTYFFSGKLDQAIQTLESLPVVSGGGTAASNDPLALYYLGRAYQEKGNLPKALPLLREVQRERPDFIEVYLHLGSIYRRMDDPGLSHFYFGKHFRFRGDGGNALLHFRTALQWLKQGSPERAEAEREIKELTEVQ